MLRIGLGLHPTDTYIGFTPYMGVLPPEFNDDLLVYCNGINLDNTRKKDLVNSYHITATEGPCLTLAVGDTMRLPMNDIPASNMGTAVFTYDGLDATVTTAGTIYGVKSTNNLEFPFCEGSGTTFGDITGTYRGEITAANPSTMWTENTQDDYFYAMDKGYWTTDPDDGAQYPYDPSTVPYFNLGLIITGLGTITVDGIVYGAGNHTIEGLFGATAMTAAYGLGETVINWTGDLVTGVYPDFSIDMNGNKGVNGAFSGVITYPLTLAVTGDSTITIDSIGYTSSGSPHTITGLSGATAMVITYGGSDDQTEFTGTDAGDVTGTSPNFSIDMGSAKSISCDCSESTAYVIDEDFEGTGEPTDWVTSGTPDYDYTVDALAGNESLHITNAGDSVLSLQLTPLPTLYAGFMFKIPVRDNTGSTTIFTTQENPLAATVLYVLNTGKLFSLCGIYSTGVTILQSGVLYYMWYRYTPSDGSDNAVCDIRLGTTPVYADATIEVSITNGTATRIPDQVSLAIGSNAFSGGIIFDNIKVSNQPIGDM